MDIQKFIMKDIFRAVGIIFTFVGVIFLAVSIGLFIRSARFHSDAVLVEGVIEKITDEKVYVSYEVDGQLISTRLGFYSSSMRPGDSITLYYDPQDPYHVEASGAQILNWIFLVMGLLESGIGIGLLITSVRRKKLTKQLKENGLRLEAEVIGISLNQQISSNDRHPYMLDCQCIMPDGSIQVLHSEPIWYDPTNMLQDSYVPVYVDRKNYKKYYVDLARVLPDQK